MICVRAQRFLETLSASVTCFVSMISVIESTALPLLVCRCGSLGCTQCVRIRCSRTDRGCMLYVPYDVTFSGRRRPGTRSLSASGRGRCRGPQACSRWSWNQRFSRGVELSAAGTSGAWRSHGPGAGAGALRLLRDGDGGRRAPGLRLTGAPVDVLGPGFLLGGSEQGLDDLRAGQACREQSRRQCGRLEVVFGGHLLDLVCHLRWQGHREAHAPVETLAGRYTVLLAYFDERSADWQD